MKKNREVTKKDGVNIPKILRNVYTVELIGVTPLVLHNFSDIAVKAIEDKQSKQASGPKEARNPDAEIESCFYWMDDNKTVHGFPSTGLKKAMTEAARNIEGVTIVQTKKVVHVYGPDKHELMPLTFSDITHRKDRVTIGKGSTDIRYRPQMHNWRAIGVVECRTGTLSDEQVLSLITEAGYSEGLGDYRAGQGYNCGKFKLGNVKVEENVAWQ